MKIISIDPGESSGVVVCTVDGHMDTFTIIDHRTISLWRGFECMLDEHQPDVIVAEQFRLYPQMARTQAFSTMVAPQVLGAVREIAERKGMPVIEQAANIGTKLQMPVHAAKELRKLKTEHEKDAAKHAYAYCLSQGVRE